MIKIVEKTWPTDFPHCWDCPVRHGLIDELISSLPEHEARVDTAVVSTKCEPNWPATMMLIKIMLEMSDLKGRIVDNEVVGELHAIPREPISLKRKATVTCPALSAKRAQ